jgi:hypothetical protein
MDQGQKLIGTTEYLTLYAWYRLNRCLYNRALLHFLTCHFSLISQAYTLYIHIKYQSKHIIYSNFIKAWLYVLTL